MIAQIKGVYTTNKDTGEEYITRNGNFYLKLLLACETGQSLYDSVFLTPKAHWRVQDIFKAAGMTAPSADQIKTNDFNELIGSEIKIAVGKNNGGFDTVTKFYPAELEPAIAPIDEIAEQVADDPTDPELDEDVPF
tara:strand:- start:1686 stop:2093 length:408 start_codon:yes stop_codon:yes gene_type:complete